MHTVDEKKQYFFKFVTSKNISFISMIKKKKISQNFTKGQRA